ncbi:amidase [Sphingorhabdus sp.]|jgi:aspartyl-tRNA(Asn)/glutamyl-tRNA(Gln) amidotransferase subunit A|uniref:amidase n=1 Tax=Sphingorhabdus sp. TaxID=1902408 RepID=UPI003D81381B
MIDWDALEVANAPLNAFTDFDTSATVAEGALAGLTIGVKANIMVNGLPWTGGCEVFRNRIAERDAEVVAKLRAAGAVIIGTTNMEEAALGAKTDNPFFGATQNPHRLGYTPGGSSGGSGAAVAAGLCDAALGTDTMGSIRIPAAYCGVYGFKPAHTAVSQDGLEMTEPSLDTIGPLARDLDVLERVSRVISNFGGGVAGGPVTLVKALGGIECELPVLHAFDAAQLALGANVEIELPYPPSRIRFAGFIQASRFLAAHLADAEPVKISPALAKLLTYGPKRSAADLAEDVQVIAETKAALKAALETCGAILMPTAPQAAFPHSKAATANQADFTCLANIAELPAIAIPAGWSNDGLPVGVQLLGKAGDEAGLFALARKLDAALAAYCQPANFGY